MTTPPDIIVDGYSARYAIAVKDLLRKEGGFVDDKTDRGGTTKNGISLRFLKAEGTFDLDGDGIADFDLNMDGDIDGRDIRLLTRGDSVWLYHRCFWQRIRAEDFARPLGEAMFDQAVNGGLTAARKLLQTALNNCLAAMRRNDRLTVDGRIGPSTMAAYHAVLTYPAFGMPVLISSYRKAAADRYRAIVARYPDQKKFLNGWLNRAAKLGGA